MGEQLNNNITDRRFRKYSKLLKEHKLSISSDPTSILFVSNSSPLVGVDYELLESVFRRFDPNCSFSLFPHSKSYTLIEFTSAEFAEEALKSLNGKQLFDPTIPASIILFVKGELKNDIIHESAQICDKSWPHGLEVLYEFIDDQFHNELSEFIMQQASSSETTQLKSRDVLHFGYTFDYSKNAALEPCAPIPELFEVLIRRFKTEHLLPENASLDQVTVNIYKPGQGIPPHVDTHSAFEEHIFSLSLLNGVIMEFRNAANPGDMCEVYLPKSSLLIMKKESRYTFKHGIPSRKYDVHPTTHKLLRRSSRISITFRKIRNKPCQCPFPEFCDSGERLMLPKNTDDALEIEKLYVEKVYNKIASHFDQTRYQCWPLIKTFINSIVPYSLLLDVGCGNGKNILYNSGNYITKIGIDLSVGLVEIAKKKGCEVVTGDALHLPFLDENFDAVISIAVIHHFSTNERRIQAIRELLRMLRKGGRACISVWSFEQSFDGKPSIFAGYHHNETSKVAFSNVHCETLERVQGSEKLSVHENGQEFCQRDILIPWHDKETGEYQYRYYHLFAHGELEELIKKATTETINGHSFVVEFESEILYDQGNWIAFLKRIC